MCIYLVFHKYQSILYMLSYLILIITVYPSFTVFHFTQDKLNYFDWVSPDAYMTRIQVQLIYMGAEPRKHWQGVGKEPGQGRKPAERAFSRQFPIWQLELRHAGQLWKVVWNTTQCQPHQRVKKLGYLSSNSPPIFGWSWPPLITTLGWSRFSFLYAEHIFKARKKSSVPESQVFRVSNLQGSEVNT